MLLANLLAFYLANILALYLAYLLAFYLAYILAFCLAYLLVFYLAYLLAFYLAYLLAYLLAFYLAYLLAFYLAYLRLFYLTFYLAFYLAYLVAFYLVVEVHRCPLSSEGPRLRSSGAHWARKVPGWGPAVPTELGRSQVKVQRCHCARKVPGWGPLRTLRLRSSRAHSDRSRQLRSSSAHCAQKLAKRSAKSWQGGSGRGSWCRHGRGETGGGGRGGGGRTALIKSNNPHLAGGEKERNALRDGLNKGARKPQWLPNLKTHVPPVFKCCVDLTLHGFDDGNILKSGCRYPVSSKAVLDESLGNVTQKAVLVKKP